jgi:hypothetical protein
MSTPRFVRRKQKYPEKKAASSMPRFFPGIVCELVVIASERTRGSFHRALRRCGCRTAPTKFALLVGNFSSAQRLEISSYNGTLEAVELFSPHRTRRILLGIST